MDGAEFLRRELGVVVRLLCTLLTGKGLKSLHLTRSLIFYLLLFCLVWVCWCACYALYLQAQTLTSYPFVDFFY